MPSRHKNAMTIFSPLSIVISYFGGRGGGTSQEMLLFLFVLAPPLIFIQIGIAPPVISLGTHENTLAVSVVLFCNFATYSCKYFLVVVICWENSCRLAVSLFFVCIQSLLSSIRKWYHIITLVILLFLAHYTQL